MLTDDGERRLQILEAIDSRNFNTITVTQAVACLDIGLAIILYSELTLTPAGRAELDRLRKLKEVSGDVAG